MIFFGLCRDVRMSKTSFMGVNFLMHSQAFYSHCWCRKEGELDIGLWPSCRVVVIVLKM